MLEKGITTGEVEQTVLQGEVIQEYKDDKPFPSLLIIFCQEKAYSYRSGSKHRDTRVYRCHLL
jgi:hypothetical protein